MQSHDLPDHQLRYEAMSTRIDSEQENTLFPA